MELNSELLSLQSTLRSLEKSTQPFHKIRYKSGNEEKVEEILDVIQLHMERHQNFAYKKDFLLLLIVNTNLENNTLSNVKEYQHLVNLIPLLSPCLLANIIVRLDLLDAYSTVLPIISFKENKDILYDLEICLKHSEMSKTLKDTYLMLNGLIDYFLSINQNNDTLERIMDIFNEMVENLAKFSPDKVENWTFMQFQEHVGYTLLHVLKLLNKCPINLGRLIGSLINSAITVMKAVTLNTFCVWAEVHYEDGTPLQLIIAGEAYITIEHLQKHEHGATLVQMLSTIAKKPKTLTEKIHEADLKTIINNVNRKKDDQIQWFRALINSNLFDDKEAINCLNKWNSLCTSDDVCRLFYLSASAEDKTVVLNCASVLSANDLKSAIIKHFWKFTNDWNVDVSNELTMLFNRMQNDYELDQDSLKHIYLLLIQNRRMFLRTLYTNCLNTAANVKNFKSILGNIKPIVEINEIAKSVFLEVFQDNFVSDENVLSYKELIKALMELGYLTDTAIISNVFQPQLEKLLENGALTTLQSTLRVLSLISVKFILQDETLSFLSFLTQLLERYRKPAGFSHHQHIVQESITLVLKFEENGPYPVWKDRLQTLQLSPMNRFYIKKLYEKTNDKILKYLFSSSNLQLKPECVAMLIKVLPMSVKTEWILIVGEIESENDYETTLSLFNSVLFLLSQIAKTQEGNEEQESLLNWCLQQYLIIIKEVLQPKHSALKEEKILVKSICALLKDLPSGIRQKEIMRVMGLLSNDALKSLKDDREFVLSLVAIQDVNVSQLIAQKVLS